MDSRYTENNSNTNFEHRTSNLKCALFEADLHCHTTASDGLLTPTELIRSAAELGIKGIGITDHDTIQGWKEAEEAGAHYQVQVLRGIELNTDWLGKEVHILGYEVEGSSNYLKDKLKALQEARELRMQEILVRLLDQGVQISADEVHRLALGETTGRPHIAQALVERGYVKNIREGFDRFIGLGAPAYVPRHKLTTEEGIKLVRDAHGVPVIAHPGVHRLENGIPEWVKVGLQGIEVSHSDHSTLDEEKYHALTQKYNLLATGGSDFHGEACKPGVKLGHWGVSLDVLQQIRTLALGNQQGR